MGLAQWNPTQEMTLPLPLDPPCPCNVPVQRDRKNEGAHLAHILPRTRKQPPWLLMFLSGGSLAWVADYALVVIYRSSGRQCVPSSFAYMAQISSGLRRIFLW